MPDLILTASGMMWRMEIQVFRISDNKLRLVLLESSLSPIGDDTDCEWEITEGHSDIVTQVGMALLDWSDWQIEGNGRCGARPANDAEQAYLALCWHNSDHTVIGRLLSNMSPQQRDEIFDALGTFEHEVVVTAAPAIFEWISQWCGDWQELTDRFGEPTTAGWWDQAAAYARSESLAHAKAKEKREERHFLEIYGSPAYVADVPRVVDEHGRDIPAGYLAHMTNFAAPAEGTLSETLLLAWGRQKRPLPTNFARTGGVHHGDGDFSFAAWILKDGKHKKLSRLKSLDDADAKAALKKLREMAKKGRKLLAQKHTGVAARMGAGLAKIRISLDPNSS